MLKLLEELENDIGGLFKDELRAVTEDVVEVTVLVTVPGVGVRYTVSEEITIVLVVDVVMADTTAEDEM